MSDGWHGMGEAWNQPCDESGGASPSPRKCAQRGAAASHHPPCTGTALTGLCVGGADCAGAAAKAGAGAAGHFAAWLWEPLLASHGGTAGDGKELMCCGWTLASLQVASKAPTSALA